MVTEPLIRYRQHGGQQHGGRKRSILGEYLAARGMTRETCLAAAARYQEAFDRLASVPGVAPAHLRLLAKKVDHQQRRAEMRGPRARRAPLIVTELWRGNYSRFAQGWKTVAQDLFL